MHYYIILSSDYIPSTIMAVTIVLGPIILLVIVKMESVLTFLEISHYVRSTREEWAPRPLDRPIAVTFQFYEIIK